EEGLYRPAFFLFDMIQALLSRFISHGRGGLMNQAFVPGEGWETDCCGWVSAGGGRRLGAGGGGGSSLAAFRSAVTSRVAFLNSLMPWPNPLASSGSFLAPNNMSTTARISTISQPPIIPANMTFID